jgi:hypothetical protein
MKSAPTPADECVTADNANAWVRTELGPLNQDILSGRRPAGDLGAAFGRSVFTHLPAPESFSNRRARQMVVLLGLVGASLARHYQEADQANRTTPERAFDPYRIGADPVPFLAYFARLADHTGTGHCHRDTYASLTRWNVPTTEVWWEGERLAVLEGVFDDGRVRTYTGAADERRFFELIKLSEAIERAANEALMPVCDATVDVHSEEALHRVGLAVVLLAELRRFNADFAALPPDEGLRVEHFMDVFRQFAVHWTDGDIPPSGALDPEALARDCILGVSTPAYRAHTRSIFPALLDAEREMLTRMMQQRPLPDMALRSLGLDSQTLAGMSTTQLRLTVGRHPILGALYLLLTAHARMSGVHLKIAKKYLFVPQRRRENAGLGDPTVVSNREGTTGMDERYLEELTRARHHHALACLNVVGGVEMDAVAGVDRVRAAAPAHLTDLVRYAGPGSDMRGPAAALVRSRAGTHDRLTRPDDAARVKIVTGASGDDDGRS